MADLISELRGMADAGTSAYSIGTVTYWTDDHLQTVLDQHNTIIDFEAMDYFQQRAGSVYEAKIYYSPYRNFEGTAVITDSAGGTISGTAYTFDWRLGRVTFGADQAGSARMISGTIYDLNASAADVWRKKASYYAGAYDVSTDNHNLKRSQLVAQARQMASYYDGLSNAANGHQIELFRGDM
jgi:hypothetical protein